MRSTSLRALIVLCMARSVTPQSTSYASPSPSPEALIPATCIDRCGCHTPPMAYQNLMGTSVRIFSGVDANVSQGCHSWNADGTLVFQQPCDYQGNAQCNDAFCSNISMAWIWLPQYTFTLHDCYVWHGGNFPALGAAPVHVGHQCAACSPSPSPSPLPQHSDSPQPSPSPIMDPSTVLVQAIFETEGATGQADEQLAMQFTIADGAGTKYGMYDVFLIGTPGAKQNVTNVYAHIRVAGQSDGSQLIATLSSGMMISPATLEAAFQTRTELTSVRVTSAEIVMLPDLEPHVYLTPLTDRRSSRAGNRTLPSQLGAKSKAVSCPRPRQRH